MKAVGRLRPTGVNKGGVPVVSSEMNIVTGSFGYTGRHITQRLISAGKKVMTLTGHPDNGSLFGGRVSAAPFNFDNPSELVKSMRGADILFNTYWIRFPYGQETYEKAVENTRILINAAVEAGVRRIVHISITNASLDSNFPYFKGKGLIEEAIIHSKMSYAIIRPTVIFGHGDILINNIAWMLRRYPVFAIPGSGDYCLQPVFVGDVADMAVNCAYQEKNLIIDAVGPDVFTFNQLVSLIAEKVGSRAGIIHLRPGLALFLSKLLGYLVKDMVLTNDEVGGLMDNLLVSQGPVTGKISLAHWLAENKNNVGSGYASELQRHYL